MSDMLHAPVQRLIIATHNRAKAGEMVTILSRRFPEFEILTLADYPRAPLPDETGSTYAQNAEIKARSAAAFTKEWALADDAGLEIDALAGAPGLYSKRFGGEHLSFPEKIDRILALMAEVPNEKRTARFRCCVAIVNGREPAGPTHVFEAQREGTIALEPRGQGGFGYDPIFFIPELGKTMAELTPTQKHEISHRGRVLATLAQFMERAGMVAR